MSESTSDFRDPAEQDAPTEANEGTQLFRPPSATDTYDELLARVERFIEAWEGEDPPEVAEFAPAEPLKLRRMALTELIKVDLEYRWQQAQPRRIEEYCDQFPELIDGAGPPPDLIYEEFHIRQRAGDTVVPGDYFERFPEQSGVLRQLFDVGDPDLTRSLTPARPTVEFQPGDSIDDFDLLLSLGKGAFASVFLARQRSLQRLVAVKVSADRGDEPQTLAQLDHPHIVRVYDQRRLPDEGVRLLYMQYVAGGTLQDVVQRIADQHPGERSGLSLLEALDPNVEASGFASPADAATRQRMAGMSWPELVWDIAIELTSALEYAHAKGVLHRDIKPANVLLTPIGQPKLADFNISFSSEVEGSAPSAYFGGSLAYMSPEQLEACDPRHGRQPSELDGRSDLYALGVLLWELLYGRRPFPDVSQAGGWSGALAALRKQRAGGPPAAPHDFDEDPRTGPLLELLGKCLAADREDRWDSAAELRQALELHRDPHAHWLLVIPPDSWRGFVLRYVAVAVVLAILLPNAVAGWFNNAFNESHVVHLDASGDLAGALHDAFERTRLAVNAMAFPIGGVVGWWLVMPLTTALASRDDPDVDAQFRRDCRRRALWISGYGALLGITLWAIFGAAAYPITLDLLTGAMTVTDYLAFFGSALVCGLIAAAYPFLLVLLVALRTLYPALIRGPRDLVEDRGDLARLLQFAQAALILAGGVPAVGLFLLAFYNSSDHGLLLITLLGLGVVGFAGAFFYAYRRVQLDIATYIGLARAATGDVSHSTVVDSI